MFPTQGMVFVLFEGFNMISIDFILNPYTISLFGSFDHWNL